MVVRGRQSGQGEGGPLHAGPSGSRSRHFAARLWIAAEARDLWCSSVLEHHCQRRLLLKSCRLSRTCLMSCTCADRTSISTALAFGSTSVEMRTTDRRLFAPRDGLIKLTLSMSISSSISFLSHKKSFFFCHERHEPCSRCRLVPSTRNGSQASRRELVPLLCGA